MLPAVEAVTVCVGYADFLRESAQFNFAHLDRWLIVTSARDEETRDLCRHLDLECLVTEEFYRGGAAFEKARGIDRALSLLSRRAWTLHLDADMVLPASFRQSLHDAHLDETCLYGADRFMVRGWDKWQKLKASGFLWLYARSHGHNVCFPEGYPVGARWADLHHGYAPIGAFQLWHHTADLWRGSRVKRYGPHGHNDAARTDMQFSLQWDRRKRVLLPEVVCAHLESDPRGAKVGANWSGRTTPRFGPPAVTRFVECPS